MQAFWRLYLANVKEFARDRVALFWTVAFPLFFVVFFGIIFSSGGNNTFPVGLADQDGGDTAQAIVAALQAVDAFEITTGTEEELLQQLRDGDLRCVVVLPAGLSAAAAAGEPANVRAYFDETSQTSSQVVLGIVNRVVGAVDQQLTQRPSLLAVEPVSITSDDLGQIEFLLPGILGMSLAQLGIFGTAPAIVAMREQHILRRLGATPLPRSTLLAAQVAHRLSIALLQTAVIMLMGMLVFRINILGNLGLLALYVVLGSLTFIALGYFIASIAKTQEGVNGIAQVFYLPMMLLSGLFFPVDLLPDWLQPVTNLFPLTYLADALRQIMVGSPPVLPLWANGALLAGWFAVCSGLAVRFFRWE